MKSGNYLSSRQFSASTFGVKELNFCVRNWNRWDLFAIITAMAISTSFRLYIYFLFVLIYPLYQGFIRTFFFNLRLGRLTTTQQTFFAKSSHQLFSFRARKNRRFIYRKDFVYLSSSLILLRSSPRPISIGQLLHYCIYTSDLSTLLSARGLTSLCCGIPYLEASFTLRCFQRLSQPHSATLLCRWRDNRCTVGAFIPVLSY